MAKAKKTAIEFPLSDVAVALKAWNFKGTDKMSVKKAQDKIDSIVENEDEIERLEAATKKEKDKEAKEIQNEILGAIDDEEEIVVVEDEEESDDDEEEGDEEEGDEEESDEDEGDEEDEEEEPKKKPKKKEKAAGGGKVERDAFGVSVNAGGHFVNLVLFDLDDDGLSAGEIDEAAQKLAKKAKADSRSPAGLLRRYTRRGVLSLSGGKYTLSKLGQKIVAGKAAFPGAPDEDEVPAKKPAKKPAKDEDDEDEKPAKKGGKSSGKAEKNGKPGKKPAKAGRK